MARIVVADFSGAIKVTASDKIYQYDRGDLLQIIGLELPELYQVHFANDEEGASVPVVATSDLVEIPEAVTQSGDDVLAYIYLTPEIDTAYTDVQARIKVTARALLPDYEYNDDQANALNRAIADLNTGVAAARAAAESAEADAETAAAAAARAMAAAEGLGCLSVTGGLLQITYEEG